MQLKNKVIIITGGSGLLGSEMMQYFKLHGATIINADINNNNSSAITFINTDVTNETSVNDLFKTVINKFGRIDGLVNNAYPRTKDWGAKFENISSDSWKKNIDLQLNSVFYLCQHALQYMREKKSGSIVNIASIYGIVGPDFSVYENTEMTMPAAYSAIKGGLINFTRYLASYAGKYKVRVNCVSPGGIFDNQPASFVTNYEKKVPLGRMGTPADISPAVAFLLSDESLYITGHNLIVDGGWTAI
jgi:NAD(P)-dependent dehydrogenase (short-subunit alcohol dehydrogenase family)